PSFLHPEPRSIKLCVFCASLWQNLPRMSENLLSRLEQSLRQSRAARMHLAARLRELEAEADSVRAELAEMDTLASQTEAAIYRLLSSVLASGNLSLGLPSDA